MHNAECTMQNAECLEKGCWDLFARSPILPPDSDALERSPVLLINHFNPHRSPHTRRERQNPDLENQECRMHNAECRMQNAECVQEGWWNLFARLPILPPDSDALERSPALLINYCNPHRSPHTRRERQNPDLENEECRMHNAECRMQNASRRVGGTFSPDFRYFPRTPTLWSVPPRY
jgi:hypothetical protein